MTPVDGERNGRLEGKVAVITGAGAGIGRATALRMAAEGAAVLVADINGESAAATVAQIQADGGVALAQIGDVAVEADVEMAIEAAVADFGRLDILHNNAAYSRDDDLDVVDTPNDAWDAMLSSVLMAAVWGCKYAIPHMARAGGGSIINMSSGAARTPLGNHLAYGAAKGALEVLTTYTAATFGPDGVRCNAIAPGFVTTEKALELFTDEILEGMRERSAAGRLAVPDDVARLAVFLASDESSYVSGQVIACNAGGARGTRW
jgi:NAD(P)-dependent dehydrogenase (short-subunit alcohol dehydrogenase family)